MAQPCIMRVLLVYCTNMHKVCNCTSKFEHNYTYIVIKWGNIFQAVCSIWGGSSLLWHNCNPAWQNWAFLTVLEDGRKLVTESTRLEYVHRSWMCPFCHCISMWNSKYLDCRKTRLDTSQLFKRTYAITRSAMKTSLKIFPLFFIYEIKWHHFYHV